MDNALVVGREQEEVQERGFHGVAGREHEERLHEIALRGGESRMNPGAPDGTLIAAMAQPTKIADLKDLPPGKSACVAFGSEKVALFNVDGTLHAISDTCSHRGGPLSQGQVAGTTVTCPLHGARFDLKTGAALGPPAMQGVKRYQVEVKGSDVFLSAL